MTYCIGLNLEQGLLFASDSRTNAGVDDVRRASKMRVFSIPGQRLVVTLSSGNLSLTQNALNLLEHRARHTPGDRTINNATSLFEVAALVGDALREIRKRDVPAGTVGGRIAATRKPDFSSSAAAATAKSASLRTTGTTGPTLFADPS